MDIDKATETQLANIEKRTGKTLAQLENDHQEQRTQQAR